jgi:competence protein ComEA
MPQFTRHEAVVLAAACVAVLAGLAVPWLGPGPSPVVVGGSPAPVPTAKPATPSPPGALSLNLATVEELERLPGIGPVLARRIVEDRGRNGQYRRLEDLLRVKGIGPKKLEKLRPHLQVP